MRDLIKGNKKAYIFPGQGSQYIGMGKDLFENFNSAQKIFKTANQVLGFSLSEICFNGPIDKLTKSSVCQPAILAVSIAAFQVLRENFQTGGSVYACAGLSLGEYSALVACGSLEFADAIALVNKRGRFMDEAGEKNPGTMSCLLGLDIQDAEQVCEQCGAEIANLNCPGQVVISGSFESIKEANAYAISRGAKRVIQLKVSGPFHSSLMLEAAEKLKLELDKVVIKPPAIPFLSNVTADYVTDEKKIKELLVKQVVHTTFWQDIVLKMSGTGIREYFEIGAGKVLRGLLQRIDRKLQIVNLEKNADFLNL
ncbi:MAG: [acyl-carrier-protein] S-malonyltransferase [Candidatus Omnitrophota bacterium]|nr:MAG: [acyl-carrier-protein] S-malonyltransferase [Candidatus Omnitrophota bacterium]